MSGIFLTLWDDVEQFDRVLKPTPSNHPHITICYSGKKLEIKKLMELGNGILKDLFGKTITLTKARINSFFHERKGKERHDILVDIEEEKEIELTRQTHLQSVSDRVIMRKPHVTVKSSWDKDDVMKELNDINKILPITVKVNGICYK
tara:strand:- start:310 stop:753 length:444 start_codon:yes stop_codon:yes gene_type:complete